MFESIISPGTAKRNPWEMLLISVLISSIAIWASHYLAGHIEAPASMLSLAIIVMAFAPLMHRVLVIEEEIEERGSHRNVFGFVTRHVDVITMYSALFIGLLVSFTFWYVVLPESSDVSPSRGEIFGLQESAVTGLQSKISGAATGDSAELKALGEVCRQTSRKVTEEEALDIWRSRFHRLFGNNIWVMIYAFAASLLFGAGALWIISWNASTIAVFTGSKIMENVAIGITMPFAISVWAIPEILAYLVAAIGGGIIAVAVAKHRFTSERGWMAIFDGLFFLLIAVILVTIGAYVEHFFLAVPCPNA